MNKISHSPTPSWDCRSLSATCNTMYEVLYIVHITTVAELFYRSFIKLYTQLWWTDTISSDSNCVSLTRKAFKRTLYNADFLTRVLAITPFQRPVWRTFKVYPKGFISFLVTIFSTTWGLTRTHLPICGRNACTSFHRSQ